MSRPAARDPVPEDLPTRPVAVFAALERHGVDYVTIGGVAVQYHGHVRTTLDVDILAGPEPENLARLAAALRDLSARLKGVDAHLLDIDPTSPRDLALGANFGLATTAGGLDVFTDAAELRGSPPWPEVRSRAVHTLVQGHRVIVIGRDDLIAIKRAAGRAKDIGDVAALTDRGARYEDEPGTS